MRRHERLHLDLTHELQGRVADGAAGHGHLPARPPRRIGEMVHAVTRRMERHRTAQHLHEVARGGEFDEALAS